MFTTQTNRALLKLRLDAEHYSPSAIANERELRAFGVTKLCDVIDVKESGYGSLPDSADYCGVDEGIPLIRGGDLSFGAIKTPEAYVPAKYHSKKCAVKAGDVLFLIKGACIDGPEGVALVPATLTHAIFNGSCYRARCTQVDSGFLVAYSLTRNFLIQKAREIANTGISYNSEESIHGFLVPSIQTQVQKYIGDKVRQAERMRELGSKRQSFAVSLLEALLHKRFSEDSILRMVLEEKCSAYRGEEIFRQLESTSGINQQGKCPQSRVPYCEMTERLDAGYYRPDFLANAKELASCGLSLEQIDALCEKCNCGATPVDVEYEPDGQGLVRTSDVRPNRFHEKTVLRTRRLNVDRNSPVAAVAGDVLFTMSGTIGYAAVVPDTDEIFSFSNTIARARVVPPNNPWFVAAFFNSSMGYKQSLRLTSGGIQGHVMPNPFKRLWVPVPDLRIQDFIGGLLQVADKVSRISELLVASAKLLVEALIKRNVTEDELIQAQTRLEQGDDSADRAILSRLCEGGWDATETRPLFPDLDAYYETLRMVVRELTEVVAK